MSAVSVRVAIASLGTSIVLLGCSAEEPSAPAPGSTTALVGARVFDGTGRPPVDGATILIRDGRVQQVGPQAAVEIPPGVTRIDVAGRTIIPGLISAHGHARVASEDQAGEGLREQLLAQLRTYALYGVTTVYSLGDDGVESVKLRDEPEQIPSDRARLFASGPSINTAKTAEEGRKGVDRLAGMGVSIVKTHVYENEPPEVYQAIIDEAHKRGFRVAAHMYYLSEARGLLDAGIDVLAHSVRDADVDEALIAALKERNVGYIPTLTRELAVFVYETTPPFFDDPFFLRGSALYGAETAQLRDPALQEKTRTSKQAQTIKQALVQARRNLKRLADAGVTIAMGTDSGGGRGRWQGYFEHTELEMMVEAGLTPMQALVAATGGAARVMQIDKELGTLDAGKWADLVILNEDPLADIRNTQAIDSVWIAGRPLATELR